MPWFRVCLGCHRSADTCWTANIRCAIMWLTWPDSVTVQHATSWAGIHRHWPRRYTSLTMTPGHHGTRALTNGTGRGRRVRPHDAPHKRTPDMKRRFSPSLIRYMMRLSAWWNRCFWAKWLKVPIGIPNFGIPKLSKYRFRIRIDSN